MLASCTSCCLHASLRGSSAPGSMTPVWARARHSRSVATHNSASPYDRAMRRFGKPLSDMFFTTCTHKPLSGCRLVVAPAARRLCPASPRSMTISGNVRPYQPLHACSTSPWALAVRTRPSFAGRVVPIAVRKDCDWVLEAVGSGEPC